MPNTRPANTQSNSAVRSVSLSLGWLTLGLLSVALAHAQGTDPATTAPSTAAPASKKAEAAEIVELSPFVVSSSKEMGYLATNTLAGTRLNTDLKDVGAAVSVYTKEFLEDINVTKLEDILTYTASTEGGGKNGNYSGLPQGAENTADIRDDPSSVNRVRALAPATRTRDYFASDIPNDSFNFENITISRGPNAILAGVGNAGGIIDSGMRKAALTGDRYGFSSRLSSYDSHREEAHINKVIIPQRLAARLDLLNDDRKFRQKPTYALDQRLYSALQWRVLDPKRGSFLGRGTFRANFESGKIKGIPPDNTTPITYMDNWFMPTSASTIDKNTGMIAPGVAYPEKAKYYWDPTLAIVDPAVVNVPTPPNPNQPNNLIRLNTPGGFFTADPAGGKPTWWQGANDTFVRNLNAATNSTGIASGFPLYSSWALIFADPTSTTAKVDPTGTVAALNGVQGFSGGIPLTSSAGTTKVYLGPGGALRGSGDVDRLRAGFYRDHITDPRIFDFYNNLLTGAMDFRRQRFTVSDFRYEQLFMDGKAGMELAYNDQSFTRYRNFAVTGGGDQGIYIDVNKYLTVYQGNGVYTDMTSRMTPPVDVATVRIPNPNYGRPFLSTQDVFTDQENGIDRRAMQVTAFFKHNFTESKLPFVQMLGKHTLSTLFFKTNIDRSNHTYSSTWDPAGQLNAANVGEPGKSAAQVNAWFYIGPSLINANSVSDVRLQSLTGARPRYGDTYTLRVFNPVINPVTGLPDPSTEKFVTGTSTPLRILSRIVDQREELSSKAFALQSNWVKNYVTTIFGWREDNDQNFTSVTPPRLANGSLDPSQIKFLPSATQSKRSMTKSIVGLLPYTLPGNTQVRAYWNEAGNFNPVGQRRNIWNEEVGSANAKTTEYGISFSAFDNKLYLRINRYKTSIQNDTVSVANPFGYISSTIDRMIRAAQQGFIPFDWGYKYSSTLPVSAITQTKDAQGNVTATNNEWTNFYQVAQAFYDTIPQRLRDHMGAQYNFDPHFTGSVAGQDLRWNPDSIVNATSLTDSVSRGLEYELIANPARGWRISLSVSKNEAVRSNVATQELMFATQWLDTLRVNPTGLTNADPTTLSPAVLAKYRLWRLGFGNKTPGTPFLTNSGPNNVNSILVNAPTYNGPFNGSASDQYDQETVSVIQGQASMSGIPTPEVRKWRANFVTRYEFQEGFLKGFSMSGSVRWQDRVGIGYPYLLPSPTVTFVDENGVSHTNSYLVSDRNHPFWGPRDIKFDVGFGYRRKLKLGGAPITWSAGVNVSNLNAKDNLIPIGQNPDGTIGFFRIPPERSWSVTNSFSF